jgi:hypothetical protein
MRVKNHSSLLHHQSFLSRPNGEIQEVTLEADKPAIKYLFLEIGAQGLFGRDLHDCGQIPTL